MSMCHFLTLLIGPNKMAFLLLMLSFKVSLDFILITRIFVSFMGTLPPDSDADEFFDAIS